MISTEVVNELDLNRAEQFGGAVKRRFISEKTEGIFFVKLPKNVWIFLIGCIWLSNWEKG